MNRFLTVAAAGLIAVLPVAAFAQPTTTAPAKTEAPVTQPATTVAPATTAKSDAKAPVTAKKTEMHSMNTAKTHAPAAKTTTAPVKG